MKTILVTHFKRITSYWLLASLSCGVAQAQLYNYKEQPLYYLCTPDELAGEITPNTPVPDDAPIQFTADNAESSIDEAILTGNVEVERGNQRLRAAKVLMNRRTNQLQATGGIVYGTPNLALRGEQVELDLDQKRGRFQEGDYYLPDRNAQGSARSVDIDREDQKSLLKDVTYSTCDRGREEWQLRARRLKLDHEAGRGIAKNMTLAVKGVPVLYFPYLSFPINNERQSGFLAPRVGVGSSNGLDVTVPYYWNIAPNQDMTISPRIASKRGVLLGTEYRFLGRKQQGDISLEYLPNDREYGSDRGSAKVTHQTRPLSGLYTDLLYQYVSDDDYLDDFSNTLGLLSPTYLERRLDARYFGGEWTALARVQSYQTIDNEVFTSNNDPYARLPQLLFDGFWPGRPYGLAYELRNELVNFDHGTKTSGVRFDLWPGVSMPLRWPAGYLTPRASYRYTAYELQDTQTGISQSPSRGAPIFSLDSGLFIERPLDWQWWNFSGVQTLEPRLFYLYVPHRNQEDIPVFDSTNLDRSYTWLFLENRFTGADRLGDANQLTTALTTRLINMSDGRERLRASVGQIQYFRDREVTLNNRSPATSNRSDLITEGLLHLSPALALRGYLQWDTDNSSARRRTLNLRYNPDGNTKLFNLGYSFAKSDENDPEQETLEQLDVSLLWPVNEQWRTLARWNYSLEDARNLEAFAGFEYSSCCWILRMVARQSRSQPQDPAENSVYLELELKGLAGIGSNITKLMEDSILGYQQTRY